MVRGVSALGVVAIGLAAPACQTTPGMPAPVPAATVSLGRDIQPVFSSRCTSCHAPGLPTPTLIGIPLLLTPGAAFASLVNQRSVQRPDLTLVVPGDPDSSLLWQKVGSDTPPVGDRMPLTGPVLSAGQLALIRTWIEQGAQDN
jgi:hypothetical protein